MYLPSERSRDMMFMCSPTNKAHLCRLLRFYLSVEVTYPYTKAAKYPKDATVGRVRQSPHQSTTRLQYSSCAIHTSGWVPAEDQKRKLATNPSHQPTSAAAVAPYSIVDRRYVPECGAQRLFRPLHVGLDHDGELEQLLARVRLPVQDGHHAALQPPLRQHDTPV